jgi:glycosyltransferase involved in cell wall biosynthesis
MNDSGQAAKRAVLIIPAYNETPTLQSVLTRAIAANSDFEVVVVDDGSQDGTGDIAARLGVTLLRHPFNMGYGAALQTGYKYALERNAALVVQMDADGQHDPTEIQELVAGIRSGKFDLIVGSRFIESTDYRMGAARSLGRKVFSALARVAGLRISDPTSGFQGMNRRVLDLYVHDFFPTDYPDVDVLLTAYRYGLRVGEHPVRMAEGSRVSTLHGGLRSFYYIYKMLLCTFTATARPVRDRAHQEVE